MDLLEERTASCPYCGEPILLILDCSVLEQQYIEDCQVCCQPIDVLLDCSDPERISVILKRDDE